MGEVGGQVVDCRNEFGWLGGDGCYYGKDVGGFLPPNEWMKTCFDPATGAYSDAGVVLLLNQPVTLGAMIRRAVSQLRMPSPVIAASPSLAGLQVVQVPVWWWLQPGSWRPQTATASLPGISITARAVPTSVTWYAGDGSSTVCDGPGTPWTAAQPPSVASPTCGHTYTSTSRTSPGGRFRLRVVITWRISWAGAGMTGTEPPAATVATATAQVVELRAVIAP